MENNLFKPIPDSYWVKPGQLLAGEYPRAKDEAESRLKLRRFLEAGITMFIDLTEPGESGLEPYTALLQTEAAALGRPVEHRRFAIPDFSVPSPAAMAQILDAIDTALEAGHIVYLHCWGGIGRTGTVVGCYLVRHGWSGEAALAHIARLRRGTPDGARLSPETEFQRQMIRSWHAAQ